MLTFDEASHKYYYKTEPVYSVTQILSGLTDFSFVNEWYLKRGTFIHKACDLLDNETLDYASLDEQIKPYLDAYIKFKADTDFEPISIEKRLYNSIYRYAGTLDRTGFLNKSYVLLDFKSGAKQISHAYQTSAYSEALRDMRVRVPEKRFALYLQKDGKYNLVRHENYNDFDNFKLQLKQFKEAINGTKG